MTERNVKERLYLAVYLLILCLSVILTFVGLNYVIEPYSSILLNISANLLGVVLLFFLIDRFFHLEDQEIADNVSALERRIENLSNRLERNTSFLKGSDDRNTSLIMSLIPDAKDVRLVGYSLENLLTAEFIENLVIFARNGGNLKVVIIDPRSQAAELVISNSSQDPIRNDINQTIKLLRQTHQRSISNTSGQIEVRIINWLPSCSMVIIDPNSPRDYLQVSINCLSYRSTPKMRPHFILTKSGNEQRWYQEYLNQFDDLWKESSPIELTDSNRNR
jgi:hypothetical protein